MESWNGRVPDQELVGQRVCIPQDLTIHSNRFPFVFSAKTWQAWRPHKTTRRPQVSTNYFDAEKLDPRDQGPPSLGGLLHLKNQENVLLKLPWSQRRTPGLATKAWSKTALCACRIGLFCHAKQVWCVSKRQAAKPPPVDCTEHWTGSFHVPTKKYLSSHWGHEAQRYPTDTSDCLDLSWGRKTAGWHQCQIALCLDSYTMIRL